MINPNLLAKAKEKGSDAQFQAWARTFPSVLSLRYGEFPNGEGRCEFSHEREVAAGAGVGIKPEYSGVPLTHMEHHLIHQHGESYFNPQEWWIEQRNKMLQNWVNGVKPPSMEEYDQQREVTIILGSPQHLRAFELGCNEHFKNSRKKDLRLTIKEVRDSRTVKQNAAMWGVIYSQMVAFYIKNPVAFIKDMARSIWRVCSVDNDTVHEMCKRLFNDGKSTKNLSKEEHSEYFERAQRHFIKYHGHEITSPVNDKGLSHFESRFN